MRHFFILSWVALTIMILEISCVENKKRVEIGDLTVAESQLQLAFERASNADTSYRNYAKALSWFHNYLDTLYIVALAYEEHMPTDPFIKRKLSWIFDYSITKRLGFINKKMESGDCKEIRNTYNINNLDKWDTKIEQDLSKYINENLLKELNEKYFSKMNDFELLETAALTDLSVAKYSYLNIPQEITLKQLIEGSLFCPLKKDVTSLAALENNLLMIMRINFKKTFAEKNSLLNKEIHYKHENYENEFYHNEYVNTFIKKSISVSKPEIEDYYKLNRKDFWVPTGFEYNIYPYDPNNPRDYQKRSNNKKVETFDFLKSNQPYSIPNAVITYFSFGRDSTVHLKLNGQFYIYVLRSSSKDSCYCPLITMEKEIKDTLINKKIEIERRKRIEQSKKSYPIKYSSDFKTIDDFFYNRIFNSIDHKQG